MAKDDSSSLTPLAVAIIGALSAGIGGIGFVIAVGGIVTQARFRGAGLPSEVSSSVTPRGVLLSVGGEVLAAAILVALALVAAVHWSPGLGLDRLPGLKKWWDKRWRLFFGLLVFVLAVDYYFVWEGGDVDSVNQFELVIGVLVADFVGAWAATTFASHAAACRDRKDTRGEALRLVGLFSVVLLLGGIAAAAGSLTNPQVRPAAVLLEDPQEAVCGLYVGQTSGHLYIGEAVPQKENKDLGVHALGAVIVVADSRVRRVAIGSSQSLTRAINRATMLAEQLPVPPGVPTTDCGPAERKSLR